VTTIGEGAFYGCSRLASITILNPDCCIDNGYPNFSKNAVIYGYAGSTAQAYAEKHNLNFEVLSEVPEPAVSLGDVDGSGAVDILDVIAVNKYILGTKMLDKAQQTAADVNKDGDVASSDSLLILKRALNIISSF